MRPRFTTRALLILISVVAIALAAILGIPRFAATRPAEIHQRAVAQEIEDWGDQYSHIDDTRSAVRAAEMIAYIAAYYSLADGADATSAAESELESTRKRSIEKIVNALESYTGARYGNDPSVWARWAATEERREHVHGEPPHALEPAAGPDSNGTPSPPAQ